MEVTRNIEFCSLNHGITKLLQAAELSLGAILNFIQKNKFLIETKMPIRIICFIAVFRDEAKWKNGKTSRQSTQY